MCHTHKFYNSHLQPSELYPEEANAYNFKITFKSKDGLFFGIITIVLALNAILQI